MRELAAGGTSVFLSSHALPEVEELADRVGILRRGPLVAVAAVHELRQQARQRISLRLASPADAEPFAAIPEVVEATAEGSTIHLVVEGSIDRVVKAAARFDVVRMSIDQADLEDVFLAYYDGGGA